VRFRLTKNFERAYGKLAPQVRDRIDEALRQFEENPRHPSLHFEKLKGSSYRTIRVDRKRYRIVLRDADDGVLELVDVDQHKTVDRKYG
jgi:mRNA-degrading endonuclease RelE of RelBE toxin-antitoxin system